VAQLGSSMTGILMDGLMSSLSLSMRRREIGIRSTFVHQRIRKRVVRDHSTYRNERRANINGEPDAALKAQE